MQRPCRRSSPVTRQSDWMVRLGRFRAGASQVLQRQAEPPGGVRHAAPGREEPGHAEPEPARFRESGEDGVGSNPRSGAAARHARVSGAYAQSGRPGPTRAFAAPPHVPGFPPHASTATARSVVPASAARASWSGSSTGQRFAGNVPRSARSDWRITVQARRISLSGRRDGLQLSPRQELRLMRSGLDQDRRDAPPQGLSARRWQTAQDIVGKGDPHLIRSSTIDGDRWQYERPEPDHGRER